MEWVEVAQEFARLKPQIATDLDMLLDGLNPRPMDCMAKEITDAEKPGNGFIDWVFYVLASMEIHIRTRSRIACFDGSADAVYFNAQRIPAELSKFVLSSAIAGFAHYKMHTPDFSLLDARMKEAYFGMGSAYYAANLSQTTLTTPGNKVEQVGYAFFSGIAEHRGITGVIAALHKMPESFQELRHPISYLERTGI